jgi:hypothetical protein
MYMDVLELASQLSLTTQKPEEINIIKQVEAVDRTLKKYKVMLAKVDEDPTWFPGSFLLWRKDPGWGWSRAMQNLSMGRVVEERVWKIATYLF